MIKIENYETLGWEHAIRGMRNPMNSWNKSDSSNYNSNGLPYHVGTNDHDLAMRLANGGSVHAKYRRMITVYVDITAPLYFWKEFDTYKVGTVSNSCSTMHKIHDKCFTLDDFSHEHLTTSNRRLLGDIIHILNYYRDEYVRKVEDFEEPLMDKKDIWWQMIQILPSSYNQKRTIMLNYEVLASIYRDRKNHKLDEWRTLCDWIESLPYSEIITL